MTTGPTRAHLTVAVLAVCALLAGCTPQTDPEPTPSPTGFASEAEAFAAAEATYRAYIDALNAVDLADPATFEPVYALGTKELNEVDSVLFSKYHAEGARVSGETIVKSVHGMEASPSSISLATCIDVSTVSLVSARGESLISPDRPNIQANEVVVQVGVDDKLSVSNIFAREGGPECDS